MPQSSLTQKRRKCSSLANGKVQLLRDYRALLGEKLEWNGPKVRQFMEFLHITEEEMAELIGTAPSVFQNRLRKGFTKQDKLLLYFYAESSHFH